jgi:hypothetical protein
MQDQVRYRHGKYPVAMFDQVRERNSVVVDEKHVRARRSTLKDICTMDIKTPAIISHASLPLWRVWTPLSY